MLHNYNIPESIFLQIIHENGGDQMGENLRKIEDCFLKFAFSKIKKDTIFFFFLQVRIGGQNNIRS